MAQALLAAAWLLAEVSGDLLPLAETRCLRCHHSSHAASMTILCSFLTFF
jgi:hypothetical protein